LFNARASNTPPVASSATTLEGTFTGNRFRYNDAIPNLTVFHLNQVNQILVGVIQQQLPAASVYNIDTQEYWVLASICSGTTPDTVSPVINVVGVPTSGNTTRIFNVQNIGYTYNNANFPSTPIALSPIGLVIDRNNQELYIITNQASFFKGANAFYGIVTDYSGNFKRLVFQQNQIPLDGGSDMLKLSTSVVFDGTYFYFLTINNAVGQKIYIFKLNSNATITQVDTHVINGIPGLTFSSSSHPPRAMTFHSGNGLIYLVWNNTVTNDNTPTSPVTSAPMYFALSFVPNSSNIFTVQVVRSGPIDIGIPIKTTTNGYSRFVPSLGQNLDTPILNHFIGHMAYLPNTNTFAVNTLETSSVNIAIDPLSTISVGFFTEVGAGVSGTWSPGTAPQITDIVWGTLSGTLAYQPVQRDSVLFPNGRFAQIDYTLNTLDGLHTPQLTESRFTEGVMIPGVPASGTKSFFVRTDIPANADLSTRTGRLKAFWGLV